MLQRIYGASFLTQKELDDHLKQLEEAKARDHRKLGKELDLFLFHPWAPASPFFLPKGAVLYNGLLEYLRDGIRQTRLPGGPDAADLRRGALQALRPLPELPREHVLDGDRRAGVRRQADELPGTLPALQGAPLVLPRPAGAVCGLRPPPPLRALGRDGGPDARAHVFPGRRAHLHALRQGRGGDLPIPRLRGRRLRRLRVHGRRDLARAASRQADRHRRAVGPRREGARRPRSRRPGVPTSSRRGTAPSTARRSTSG